MASTRLQRKARRNKAVAKRKVDTIKRLSSKPVIKNVDVEEIKKEFAKGKGKKASPAAEKASAKAAEKEQTTVEKAEAIAEKAEKKQPKAEKKEDSTEKETKE